MIKKTLMAKSFMIVAALAMLTACQPQKISDERLEKAIAKYIKEHPKDVLASIRSAAQGQGGQGGQAAGNPASDKAAIQKAMPKILSGNHHAILGNRNSKNVIVEFYDYNCGFCKKALETVLKLANEDKAKVILVELPVLGPTSESAAKASTIVNALAPGKFLEFYKTLLAGEGHNLDDAKIAAAVTAAGISPEKYQAEAAKPKYAQIIAENTAIAGELGIRGTPSFIVNDAMVRGALPYESFKAQLKK